VYANDARPGLGGAVPFYRDMIATKLTDPMDELADESLKGNQEHFLTRWMARQDLDKRVPHYLQLAEDDGYATYPDTREVIPRFDAVLQSSFLSPIVDVAATGAVVEAASGPEALESSLPTSWTRTRRRRERRDNNNTNNDESNYFTSGSGDSSSCRRSAAAMAEFLMLATPALIVKT